MGAQWESDQAPWPASSGTFHRFISIDNPANDLADCICRTPDKFQGKRKGGVYEGSFQLQFTLPGRDDEPKTIELLQSTDEEIASFGAVRVKLPIDARVIEVDSRLLVEQIRENSNADNSRIREGDIIRAVSVPDTGADAREDVPWWARIGRPAVPDAEEGMVILHERSAAEFNAVLEENLRVNGKGSEVVLLVERLSEKDQPGKFVRVGDDRVPHAFGPRAVVVGGYNDRELEVIDEIIDRVGENAIVEMPVIVLAQEDGRTRLKDLLEQRKERDHVLPDEKPMNIEPFILLSGLPMPRVKEIFNGMRAMGLPPSAKAIAVPGALGKSMQQLTNEVIDDFIANQNQ